MPAEGAARGVVAVIEAVAPERRQIDAADPRDAVVDDDRLLVVAVHRPLACVERRPDARSAGERVAQLPNVAARGLEQRQRRTSPREHADVDALSEVPQQLAQRRAVRAQPEGRREVPAGDQHGRLRALEIVRDPRQRLGPVDDHLELIALPRLRLAVGPEPGIWTIERMLPPETPQAAPVVAGYRALDAVAERNVEPFERVRHRTPSVSTHRAARVR